ncbi:MAG: class A beta-lactamase-related serine hydrolase [Lactobacillales bacterium]|jgi:hypothetical protein|nr:class A beta-lactamase-related serine hydrolase [Lactobacillales bacterium]
MTKYIYLALGLVALVGVVLFGIVLKPTPASQATETIEKTISLVPEEYPQDADTPKKLDFTAVQQAVDSATTTVDVAVYERKTGQFFEAKNGEDFPMASVAKVPILMNLLVNHVDYDKQLAYNMIVKSDNDPANGLLLKGTYENYDALFKKLDMTNTKRSSYAWGLSLTDAGDMIKMLNEIFYVTQNELLTEQDAKYLADLMKQVEPYQKWGVSAGPGKENTALKNGWNALDGYGWVINSIGHVKTNQLDYTIAIMTKNNKDMASGIAEVENLSETVYNAISETEENND